MGKFVLGAIGALALLGMAPGASDAADLFVPKKCAAVHVGPVAVFIEPTEEEKAVLKRAHGAEDFSDIADHIMWYDWRAMKYLSKRDIPFCFTTEERHEFRAGGETRYSADRKCPDWCLLLWNGKDEPVYTDSIDVDMYEDYLAGE